MKLPTFIHSINNCLIKIFNINNIGNLIDKQRFYIYIYLSIGVIVGISINLCGITGPQGLFFKLANSIHIALTIGLLLLAFCGKLKIHKALVILIIISQLEMSAEMLYSAFVGDLYSIALIIGNMSLLSILLMLSIIAYIRYIPIVISTISMVTYGVCVLITNNDCLLNFFLLFILANLVLTLMSLLFIKQFNKLLNENSGLRRQNHDMLNLFNMDHVQIQAYLKLINYRVESKAEIEHLMEQIGGEMRKNLRYNIHLLVEQETINFAKMERAFPQLSVSEREICHLVLEGKKLGEIGRILGKSESNISCQRSNIRAKFDLKRGADLREKLLEICQDD